MRRVLALLAVLAVGCSVQVQLGKGENRPAGHRMASKTPHITATDGAGGTRLLLTTADLRAVDGLPGDLVVQSVDKTELYENPDPRGVCGGKVEAPTLDGALKGIGSSVAFGFESATDLGVDDSSRFLATERAEARPGCADWTSKTNTGSTQRGHFVGEVDIPEVGHDRIATQLRMENQGQSFEVTSIEIRVDGMLVTFQLATPSRLPSEVVVALAERLGARLTS